MKKNISIMVLFGLLLVFGVLVASCDNGVLPDITPDDLHRNPDGKDGSSVGNPMDSSYWTGGAAAADTSGWGTFAATDIVYQDYWTGSAVGVDVNGNQVGIGPGDGDADLTTAGDKVVLGTASVVKGLIDAKHVAAKDGSDLILKLLP